MAGTRDGWVRVCAVDDVAPGTALAVEVGETPVAVVRTEGPCGEGDDGHDGEFHAIHDECSHAEIPLSEGEVDGCTLECWLHGSRFDLRTGKPTGLPATAPVPVYPVQVDGDDVFVRVTADDGPDAASSSSPNPSAPLSARVNQESTP